MRRQQSGLFRRIVVALVLTCSLTLVACEAVIDAVADLLSCAFSLANQDRGKVCGCGLLGQDAYGLTDEETNITTYYTCDDDEVLGWLDWGWDDWAWDDPDAPPGWTEPQIESDCYGGTFRITSIVVVSDTGYYWMTLERNGQVVAYSYAAYLEPGEYPGIFVYFPLSDLIVDTVEYAVSSYFSEDLADIGNTRIAGLRNTNMDYYSFSPSLAKSINSVAKSGRMQSEKHVSELCTYVGIEKSFAATYNPDGELRIYEGRWIPFEDGLTWEILGNRQNAASITSDGVFTPLDTAYSFGDCLIVATDWAGKADTVNVTIHRNCAFSPTLAVDGQVAMQDECVYISEIPSMPSIIASVPPDIAPQQIDWKAIIRYTRSGREDYDTLEATLDYTEQWNITEALSGAFRGGQAVIQCSPRDLPCSSYATIWIRGINPTEVHAESYITDTVNASLSKWYWKYVAIHESDAGTQQRLYAQFNEIGPFNCDDDDVRYTPNASNDGGFGIYQLTNFYYKRKPNPDELWNWKENVNSGTLTLNDKQIQADNKMQIFRDAAGATNPVGAHTIGGVTFSDGTTYIMEHAVALKRYNGLGVDTALGRTGLFHDYCEWTGNEWQFYPWSYYWKDTTRTELDSNRYVGSVCDLVVQKNEEEQWSQE